MICMKGDANLMATSKIPTVRNLLIELLDDGPWCSWEMSVCSKESKSALAKELALMAKEQLVELSGDRTIDPVTGGSCRRYMLTAKGRRLLK